MTTPPPPWKLLSFNEHPMKPLSTVVIYHPINGQAFLSFYAHPYPIEGGLSSQGGLPRSLIIDSCRILTGTYTENVFICLKDQPSSSIEFDILPADHYVYIVGSLNQSINYGVYTNFHTWNPPVRAQVPDHWFTPQFPKEVPPDFVYPWDPQMWPEQSDMRSAMSEVAKELDLQTCCLTLVGSTTLEGCHAVPVEEQSFYVSRRIHLQLLPDYPIPNLNGEQMVHDIRNFVTLGGTIHRLWDTHIMGFYPLPIGSYVAYFFQSDGYAELFHFKKLRLPGHTDPYLMYIRFALTVFHSRLSYHGVQPSDALASCVKVFFPNKRKAQNSRERDGASVNSSGGGEVEEGGGSGMATDLDDESGSSDRIPLVNGYPQFVLDSLIEDVQAKGTMLSEELQALVGDYYPEAEKTRINNVAIEYLRNHPTVGPMAEREIGSTSHCSTSNNTP